MKMSRNGSCRSARWLVVVVMMGVLLESQVVMGELSFSLGSCNGGQSGRLSNGRREAMAFVNSQVSPYPIVLPGDFSVTSSMHVLENVTGDITLDVTIQRDFGLFTLDIPCIHGVGSCQIRDVCGFLRSHYGNDNNRGCPPQFRRDGVPCTCPLSPGMYTMSDEVFSVPRLSTLWAWLAQGDYIATAKLIDEASGREIACQRLTLTIEAPCTNFWCRFFSL